MQHISLFFDKYRNIEKNNIEEKELVCKAIYEVTGFVLPNAAVNVSNGVVRVKLTPGERSFFLEKKEEIIPKLSKQLGQNISQIG